MSRAQTRSAPAVPALRPPGRGTDPDAALLEALRAGAPGATESLLIAYGDRAYRLALHITGNGADAEEVVQDAVWAIIRKVAGFRGDSAFGSWVYRIVANAACQRLRRRRASRADVSLDEASTLGHEGATDWSAGVEDPAIQSDLRRVLTAAVNAMPAEYRTAVVLRDVEGLSNHEVSAALGITLANVKTRVHRGRLFLRRRLAAYMDDATAVYAA